MLFAAVFFPFDEKIYVYPLGELGIKEKPPIDMMGMIGTKITKEFQMHDLDESGLTTRILQPFEGYVVYVDECEYVQFFIFLRRVPYHVHV